MYIAGYLSSTFMKKMVYFKIRRRKVLAVSLKGFQSDNVNEGSVFVKGGN